MDTIFAQATAPGRSGVAIVRVSGPQAFDIAEGLAGPDLSPRRSYLRAFRNATGILDRGIVLVFEADASFTGERVAEFHCHGSPAVVSAMLSHLGQQPGLRMAEPGEFTRRALTNGCLDLSQIEGLADLLDAETESQRKQALQVFDGALSSKVADWRADMIRAAALIEVTIDFADEEVPEDVYPEVSDLLVRTKASISAEIAGSFAAERIRDGFTVAILGPPNAGKSTLLNFIAGREIAITSDIPGTTRDVLEVRIDLKGLAVTLLDTAGLRHAEDAIESLGVARARDRAALADLRVFLSDGTAPEYELGEADILVRGKADEGGFGVSGRTGHGVPELLDRIFDALSSRAAGSGLAIRERHRVALEQSAARIEKVQALIDQGQAEEAILASELQSAIRALNSLIGKVDTEDLLDEIFASFCLGK